MSVLALFAQANGTAPVLPEAPARQDRAAHAMPDVEPVPATDAPRAIEPSPANETVCANGAVELVEPASDKLIDPVSGDEFAVEIRTANAGVIWLVNKKTGRFPRELTPTDIRDLEGVKAAFERAWPGAPFAIADVVFTSDPDRS